jgi:hypothetical protein
MVRVIFVVALGILLGACATESSVPPASDNWKSAEYLGLPKNASIILLTPEESEGDEALVAQLGVQLTQLGYKPARLERQNYQLIWAQEVAAVGGVYDSSTGKLRKEEYALAQARLAVRICRETGAAMVLQAGLTVRPANLQRDRAIWDGQARILSFQNPVDRWEYDYRGGTKAVSVELRARSSSGTPMFLSYGGVSVLYAFDTKAGRAKVRKDLFSDPQEMASGVREALRPLSSPTEFAKERRP